MQVYPCARPSTNPEDRFARMLPRIMRDAWPNVGICRGRREKTR